MKSRLLFSVLVCASLTFGTAAAQQSAAPVVVTASSAVPSLINYTGVLKDAGGRILNSVTGVTFLLYKEEQGGAPLWLEMQNVTPDKTGHYTVQLGGTSAKGLPPDLFVSGEGRWLAVQVGSETEQPRELLVAVPYAMKAVDAETLGGLPASAFVLAAPPSGSAASTAKGSAAGASGSSSPLAPSNVTTTIGGVVNTLPLWTTGTNIESSVITQSGTKIGINTTTPAATLDVKGGETLRGLFYLTTSGTATAAAGKNSYAFDIVGTSFNSTTSTSLNQTFQWLVEPVANNTANPSGALHLLYGLGATAPSETGLKISNTGVFTFAPGQTFPGTGSGSVTSVGSGSGLTGGPITSSGTLSIATAGVTNAMLVNPSLTVTAGADLTGGGAVSLGGSTTLNLDTSKVPLLAAANTFTASQTVSGDLTATALLTSGINFFDPGYSIFIGVEPSYEVEVENSGGGNGIITYNNATTGASAGVYAAAPHSATGVGVYGQQGAESGSSSNVYSLSRGIGVFGDGGTTASGMGVAGTANEGDAGYFRNNSSSGWQTVWIESDGSATPFEAYNGANGSYCYVDNSGNLNCSGSKNAVVPIDGGARSVAMSAIEAPQNWFEDAGSGELVNGVAIVALDRDFTQTVNTGMNYKVFPVPNGDCKGLYVTNKTATSFEVRELGGGTSNVSFDYRIMALRRKYENVRFADRTQDVQQTERMQARVLMGPLQSHTPNPNLQPRPASPKALLAPAATKPRAR